MAKVLSGWKRTRTAHGIVLTLQLIDSPADFAAQRFEKVNVAMNDRQLRSFARDITRAAQDRGLDLFAKKPWWRFWSQRSIRLLRPGVEQ